MCFVLQVVYFTAIFPYVVLLILFFNGVFLSNAGEGIYYYIVPDFSRLLDPRVSLEEGASSIHINLEKRFISIHRVSLEKGFITINRVNLEK